MDSLVPRQPTNHWSEFVNKLNGGYKLELRVPSLGLSPRKRRGMTKTDDEALAMRIHDRIRQLSYSDPGILERVDSEFNQETKKICSNWVRKPGAATDLLPETDTLPKASNTTERRELRNCLLKILETHCDKGPRIQSQPTQASPCSTILSDEKPRESDGGPAVFNGSPSKKAQSRMDGVSCCTTFPSLNANRSFVVKNNLAATHPPPNHPFSGLSSPAPQAHGPRPSAPGGRIVNQESANTSITTRPSEIFSSYDSDSSQSTVPNDDREEYKDIDLHRPQTPIRPADMESPVHLHGDASSSFLWPFTSSEEHAMMKPDPIINMDGPTCPVEVSDDSELPDVALTGSDQNTESGYAEATMTIRQRGPFASVPSISVTENTNPSVDLDDTLSIHGGFPTRHQALTVEDQLRDSWPKLPESLVNVPLPVIWEVTRAALHCGVQLQDLRMQYDASWEEDPAQFRKALATHPKFRDKALPGKCDNDAWRAAFRAFRYRGRSVTLAMDARYNYNRAHPLYNFSLQPLKLEKSHRLARRFGADRFLEVTIPSPTGRDKPKWLQTNELIALLAQSDQMFLGRLWRSFYTKDDEKKETQDLVLRTETKTFPQKRLYFFAVDGNHFEASLTDTLPAKADATDVRRRRVKMKVDTLLEWAISLSRNTGQPVLKLFSRLALSLSKTSPAIILEKDQIIEREDLTSPDGKVVMNDGIGRMSPSLAKAITARLGFQEMPSGFQGRLGPYKGFWVIDGSSNNDSKIWIEGYSSQRKWDCDFDDADHRTFEVQDWARRLTPGSLNEQFIPVLENQARGNRSGMKEAIRLLLEETVNRALEEQTRATEDPVALLSWAHQNSSASRGEKIDNRQLPVLGGRPNSDEDMLEYLMVTGFSPRFGFIQELVTKLARQRCESLKDKMKITVPQSAYAFMVVDFAGVLEEGQVHLAFSRGSDCDTRRPDGIPRNWLHGHDVLVARTPAHFPSDVQKVRAVFRPELGHLQDMVVFSRKGDKPLADLLSGGDYDGDKAWVCWDPSIVHNFQNAPVPKQPNLFKRFDGDTKGYLSKDKRTFKDLLFSCGYDWSAATSKFLRDSFAFNMESTLLGICTKYKEKVCYQTGSIDDDKAIILSTLVSHLVDQAKQGIVFSDSEYQRLKRDLIRISFDNGEEPAYKGPKYSGSGTPRHILDWLKFKIAMPLIDHGLTKFDKAISGTREETRWDPDLAYYYTDLEMMAEPTSKDSKYYSELRRTLQRDINEVFDHWKNSVSVPFQERVEAAHSMWCKIRPSKAALEKHHVRIKLVGPQGDPDSFNYWGKLKASVTYHMTHKQNPTFAWWVAGVHLGHIKAEMQSVKTGRPAFGVVEEMFVVHCPDKKMVKAILAKNEDEDADAESVSRFWRDDEEADDL